MKTFRLLDDVKFSEKNVRAESLGSNEEARALRFAFLPGQEIEAHESPHSPVHILILQGRGHFAGADGAGKECSEGMMVSFDADETHRVRAADDEKLVYIAIYKENPAAEIYAREHHQKVSG